MQKFNQKFKNLPIKINLDPEGDKKSQKILNELENIDDECEENSAQFTLVTS